MLQHLRRHRLITLALLVFEVRETISQYYILIRTVTVCVTECAYQLLICTYNF